ncbi:MAG: PAS domain-containing protein [Oligoflexus sp.]|nr:PAS domain-containing protein [Oligoflexus sp.]
MAKSEQDYVTDLDPSFQNLLASMPDPIAYVTIGRRCVFTNRAFEIEAGKSANEIRDSALSLVFDQQILSYIDKSVLHFDHDSTNSIDTKILLNRSHGSIHGYEFFPQHNSDGKLLGIFIHGHTLQKNKYPYESAHELTELDSTPFHSKESLLKASRPSGLGFWSLDIATMLVSLSAKVSTEWEIKSDEFAETMDQCIERVYFEDQPKARAALKATLEQNVDYWVEYRMLMPDNDFMWIESRAETIYDKDNKPIRLIGTIHDITNRKNLEKVLIESEKRFRTLADFIPQIVWTANAEGRIDYCNKNGLEYVGLTMEQAQTGDFLFAIHPEDRIAALPIWSRSVIHGQPFEIELRLLKAADTSFRWHLTRGLALKNNQGEVVKWLGTSTDIHEQKRLVEDLRMANLQAEKGMAIKSSFIANMSHEIRTPLTAILGFTKLLASPGISTEARANYFQIIDQNGKALTKIIDDILDISKFEAGKFKIESIDFSLDELLKEVTNMFEKSAQEKGVRIVLQSGAIAIDRLKSDPSRLRQILINILGNATKFTDRGEICIEATTQALNDREVQIQIRIKDSGVGLSTEQASLLFEPFSQADESTTRKYGGSGLGLTLSRRFARALGGDVSLEAFALNEGCTFVITAIAEAAEGWLSPAQAATVIDPNMRENREMRQNLRALVVDDALENQFLLSEILVEQGIKVSLASDGREAIDKAMESHPDFILMDMQMPILDGYSATRELRRLGFKNPIIALTAMALKEDEARIIECGCNIHLTKPIDFKLLFDTIADYTEV